MVRRVVVRLGVAGVARRGSERLGEVWQARHGLVGSGEAGRGLARRGVVWQAWIGMARRGTVRQVLKEYLK